MAETIPGAPDKKAIQLQEEELEKKNKKMYPIIITVLILIFSLGFAYGLRLILNIEGTYPPASLEEGKTPVPQTNEELVAYLNGCIAETLAEKPAMSGDWNIAVNRDSIQTDGGEALQKTLEFLAEPVETNLSGAVEVQGAAFGEALDDKLRMPDFSADDIESFTCDYIYYSCRACGTQSAEPVDSCAICESASPYEKHFRDAYIFTVLLKYSDELADRLFAPGKDQILANMLPSLAGYALLEDVSAKNISLYVCFETNRMTDRLLSMRYIKNADVSATLIPVSDAPKANCSVSVSTATAFSFTWAGIVLNWHALALEPGAKEQFTAERICDDPNAYTLTWTSSDESVAKVDKNGYIKAGKLTGSEPGHTTVTVSYTFNGKTYSDSCEVYVKVPVEFLQVSRHKLSLKAGETYTLTARVESDNKGFAFKKPTVQTVTWYTTDESVATVDENGNVTAVGVGEASVYAISDDGWYRSSCKVTVE